MTKRRLPPALEELATPTLAGFIHPSNREVWTKADLLDWLYGKEDTDRSSLLDRSPGLVERVEHQASIIERQVRVKRGTQIGPFGKVSAAGVLDALRAELGEDDNG